MRFAAAFLLLASAGLAAANEAAFIVPDSPTPVREAAGMGERKKEKDSSRCFF